MTGSMTGLRRDVAVVTAKGDRWVDVYIIVL
jgi:hypothetical protein